MPLKRKPQIPLRRFSTNQGSKYFEPLDIWGLSSLPSYYTGNTYFSLNEVRVRDEWDGDNQIKNESGSDLQLNAGGYILGDSTKTDNLTIPSITLDSDFSVLFTSNYISTFDPILGQDTSNWIGFANSSTFRVRNNSINYNFTTSTIGWSEWCLIYTGSSLSLYKDNILIEEKTGVSLTDNTIVYLGSNAAVTFDCALKDLTIFKKAINEEERNKLFNNPQNYISLSLEYSAERIYPFNDGKYQNNDLALDYSVNNNNATFVTSGIGSYDAYFGDSSIGYQLPVSAFNRYSSISTPTLSPTGDYIVTGINYNSTTDLFGNSFQTPFINGILNFPSQDSNQSSSLDLGVNKTVIFFINTTDLTQVIFNTTSGGATISATSGTVSDSTGTFNIDGSIISGEWSYIVLTDSTGLDLDSFSVDDEMNGQITWTTFSKLVGESELNSIKVYFNGLV